MSDFTRNLKDTVSAAARRLEVELKGDSHELRTLAAELTADLTLAAGQPGFDEALVAARDAVMLKLGVDAVEIGDAADAELRGIILGMLAQAAS